MNIEVVVKIDDETIDSHRRPQLRLVPRLGAVREQSAPVVPTPRYRTPSPCFRNTLMAFQLTDSQKVDVTITPVDKKGNAAQVTDVTWSTDNTDVLALTPSADGLTCTVAAVGPLTAPGSSVLVTVSADADLGAGVTALVGTLEVVVTAGAATTITVNPAAPVEQ